MCNSDKYGQFEYKLIYAQATRRKKTRKIQASLDYAPLRQSIIYALVEFGPQNAKQILDTISREYEYLPLRGKNGIGLNSHLFSMKKDKILISSENIPPIWSVNETWGGGKKNLNKTTNNNFFVFFIFWCIIYIKNKIDPPRGTVMFVS